MGDHKHRAFLHQIRQRSLHQLLGFGIEFGSGFVQNQDRRILQQGAGNRQPLPLPAAQALATFTQYRLISLGHGHDEVVRQRGPGRRVHPLFA